MAHNTPAPRRLSFDGWLLFATRWMRLFAYGLLAVVLVLYLTELGLSDFQVGLLLTLTLLGDMAISLWLTTTADRFGRRRMLMAGSLLMVFTAVVFAATDNYWLLLIAATVGVISPSGNEVGPFLSIEQAAIAQTLSDERRTATFAWYSLVGSLATAVGALTGGFITQLAQDAGFMGASRYRPLVIVYGVVGLLLLVMFALLSPTAEASQKNRTVALPKIMKFSLGLHRSRTVVLHLAGLFALDAFGGGFVIQSIVAYWFHLRFDVGPGYLGSIFFAANLLAGFSALAAGWLAKRFGLVETMVLTHLPSNVLLILVPLMPDAAWAIAVLLLRFSISQMDVPTRQSYTMAVVSPDERSAASGVTGVARSIGAAVSPSLATLLVGVPALMSAPFILAGAIKIVYDLLLFRSFVAVRPSEEQGG
jgi:MFS family permease